MPIQPIFVFSLSRSGSTLVQRVLAAHKGVATVSEPWLLIPHAYAFRRMGIDAEYPHAAMVDAIEDFCKELPDGVEGYRRELHDMYIGLYQQAAGVDARYFVDKSPYQLVIDQVVELFPEAKLVFLWRNPLSVIASIMNTWEHSRWKPTFFREELFIGLPRLIAAFQRHGARAHAVRFEDLVDGNERHWVALMDYLGIEFEPDALERFSQVKLNGRMGDPTGVKMYTALSTEPVQKWRRALANPLRREWCRRYLRLLGEERLSLIGYDLHQTLHELGEQPLSLEGMPGDLARLVVDLAKEPIRVRTRSRKLGSPNVIRALLSA